MKAKVTVGLLALAMLADPGAARAQLFGGCGTTPLNPCFSVDTDEITQTIAVLQQAVTEYELLKQAVNTLDNLPNEYRQILLSYWNALNPANQCPTCAVWATAANSGNPINDLTYGGAVTQLLNLTALYNVLGPDAQARLQATLANSVYLRQAIINNDLGALGGARSNDMQMQAYVTQCQADVLNQGLWSLVQATQSSGACQTVATQQQDITTNMLGRLVDHASVAEAKRMDSEINDLNYRVAKAQYQQNAGGDVAGLDAVIANRGNN
jgi:hypothetical protein